MSPTAVPTLRGEIETPRPLRATEEKCVITGWCLLLDSPEAPPVRLATAAGVLPMTTRQERTDVPRLFPTQPASVRCGFVIVGQLPSGVHLGSFEAQLPDGSWQSFKLLSIAVAPAPFVAVVESPATAGPVSLRVQVEGWAIHPTQPIKELTLRYGHQEIPCTLGGLRSDVPLLHPESPRAAQAGFASSLILGAGRGPLRLKALLADGSVALSHTPLTIEVRSDENIGPEIDLSGNRFPLPGYKRRPAPRAAIKSSRPLNILFVLHGSFSSNSALHVAALANELSQADHDCAVAVPHDLATLAQHEGASFRGITYQEAEHNLSFSNGRNPDLIHAWTTRENVRSLTEKIRARHRCKVIVHLEDNELELLAQTVNRSTGELTQLSTPELDHLVPPDLSHPHRSREFLAIADGFTVITEKLSELLPLGKPSHLIVPAADPRYFFPRPIPVEFRRLLDVQPHTTLLFYHGNTHAANAAEVRELYAALVLLNEAGHAVSLIRTGLDRVNFLSSLSARAKPFVIDLGQIPHHRHLPPLMALADIFVQPGVPDQFNDYRFPSKLPEFFSIGRPVVLPRSNLGAQLRHGVDAYVLDRADAAGIAHAVIDLRHDRALYDQLSRGAAAYAETHFSWSQSAATLAKFYSTLTA